MLTNIPWRLIGIGAGVLALIALLWIINGWRVDAAERKAKLEVICQTTREASANPKLACKDVPLQITQLGKAIADLKTGIAHQNAAVNELGAKTAQAQAESKQASQRAATRAREAEATAERLRASARSTGAPSASCPPSKVLSESWR